MIPFWWACWTAWQTGTNSSSRCRGVRWLLVAVLGDRHALDQLHDEVRPARCRSCRRRAPWRCSGGPSAPAPAARPRSGRSPAGVSMPGLMTLSATLRLDRLGLLGHVDDAHAPFADLLQQLVRADLRAGLLGERLVDGGLDRVELATPGSCRLARAPRAAARLGRAAAASSPQASSRYAARSLGRARSQRASRKMSSAFVAWCSCSGSCASLPHKSMRDSARESPQIAKNFREASISVVVGLQLA